MFDMLLHRQHTGEARPSGRIGGGDLAVPRADSRLPAIDRLVAVFFQVVEVERAQRFRLVALARVERIGDHR